MARDISRDISHHLSEHGYDPERYTTVRNRLDEINHLKSKYGNSLETIQEYRAEIAEKEENFDQYFIKKAELEKQIHDSGLQLNEISFILSEKRKALAKEIEPQVIRNLQDLNFLDCRFEIRIEKLEKITGNGFDKVEFLISTNPGEPLKPLAKVASGGELSRIMLALRTISADTDGIHTLIFDEIDTGISGKTAAAVARRMHKIAADHQVLCISHLPQIVAAADHHFLIEKTADDGSAVTRVQELSEQESIRELARLLGAEETTELGIANAREMKKRMQN